MRLDRENACKWMSRCLDKSTVERSFNLIGFCILACRSTKRYNKIEAEKWNDDIC